MTDGQRRERPNVTKASGREGEGSRHTLTRRGFLGAGALAGLAAMAWPAERAWAWSSWTNATSEQLKKYGMGDCIHEDLVQIAYARLISSHRADAEEADPTESLLSPWCGTIRDSDNRYADAAGCVLDIGEGKTFDDAADLAKRIYRENLAYLRIGSFWNDAAADTLADFGYSCFYAESVPKFSGPDHYTGAWDVGQHIWETNEKNKTYTIGGLDALVQFTMNDRNNFIHGMLTSTASHAAHLTQAEIKTFALQWLSVAYEYARTGEVKATADVPTVEQAQKIFKGFIDTYGQLDESAHGMRVSLKASDSEASTKLPARRLRLRALGMMCHTLEDFWCPSHTIRTYRDGDGVAKNAILAFGNYKVQNGNKSPMSGYHIPFDRYAISDVKNTVNWREALTRGNNGDYLGTETLAKATNDAMAAALEGANDCFNTLGMNEAVDCITKLFEHFYANHEWPEVRAWLES